VILNGVEVLVVFALGQVVWHSWAIQVSTNKCQIITCCVLVCCVILFYKSGLILIDLNLACGKMTFGLSRVCTLYVISSENIECHLILLNLRMM